MLLISNTRRLGRLVRNASRLPPIKRQIQFKLYYEPLGQDPLVEADKPKVRFPSRSNVSGYWGRLVAGILFTLFIALNAQVGAISPPSPSQRPDWAEPIKAIAVLPDTPLKPVEPLQPVFVSKLRDYGTYYNLYAPNNCTSYVASRLPIPNNWGNASAWAYSAAVAGYKVSSVPDVGTIATNSTDSYLGHVAIVAEISGGMVRLEEQNYEGPGVISGDRWAPISQYLYIYV